MSPGGSVSPTEAPAVKGVRVGVVESDRRDKSRTVVFHEVRPHPRYGKYIRTETRVQVHDEANESRAGDRVEVAPCRPVSRTKRWRLVRVVERRPQE